MNPLDAREPQRSLDTVVAGMSCREVLHHLNDFLDGDLSQEAVTRVTAHLAGCHTCEAFGGRVGALIASLRAPGRVESDDAIPAGATERLRSRLAAERR